MRSCQERYLLYSSYFSKKIKAPILPPINNNQNDYNQARKQDGNNSGMNLTKILTADPDLTMTPEQTLELSRQNTDVLMQD